MMCLECFQSIHSVQVYLLDHQHAWIPLLPSSKAPCSTVDTISKNIHTYKIDVNSNKHGKKVAKTGSSKYVSFIHENNNSFPFSPHHRTCYFHGLWLASTIRERILEICYLTYSARHNWKCSRNIHWNNEWWNLTKPCVVTTCVSCKMAVKTAHFCVFKTTDYTDAPYFK